jgi:hypothetical protein
MTVTEPSDAVPSVGLLPAVPTALEPEEAVPVLSVDPLVPDIADPSVLDPDDPPMTVTEEELSD